MTAEVQLMIYAFLGVLAANAVRWIYRWVSNYVAKTPNKIDDKIWNAVKSAVAEAVEEAVEEVADRDLSDWEDDLASREKIVAKQGQSVKLLRNDLATREKSLTTREMKLAGKDGSASDRIRDLPRGLEITD